MITVEHLTKWYGGTRAVVDLCFSIEKHGVYGFLGPNGAGKSTTLNILTGCLSPTQGTVTVCGHDILEEPKKAKELTVTFYRQDGTTVLAQANGKTLCTLPRAQVVTLTESFNAILLG